MNFSPMKPTGSNSMNYNLPNVNLPSNNIMMNQQQHDPVAISNDTLMMQQFGTTRYMNQKDKELMYQLCNYYNEKSTSRRKDIQEKISELVKIVQDVLKELEIQEPRFISTFVDVDGYYEGM